VSFYVTRSWGRRSNEVAISKALQIVYILELKGSTERDDRFLQIQGAETNEQQKSIIGALRAAAPKWEFEQIKFVVGNRGSVVDFDFYTKLIKLDVQKGKKDKIFGDHMTQVCKNTRSGDRVLPPAGARICEANHRWIQGEQ